MDLRARPYVPQPQLENYRDIRMLTRCRQLFALSLLFAASACALFKPQDHFGSREVTFDALPGWQQDNHQEALAVFLSSCEVFARKARPQSEGSGLKISESVWRSLCDDGARSQLSNEQARLFFERRFVPFRVNNNGKEQGLFTGYYEPVLYGSYKKHGDFIYPLYAAPPELKDSKPFLSREEIDGGALKGRHLEIIWVDDPVMIFFMQIQGSGRVRLMNGQQVQLGYADGNGQPYVSLGKIMGDEGLIAKDQVNFFTIRQWLYDHPQQAFAMMQRNPSYIFFKKLDKLGAVGAAGVPLTPKRSLAVDSKHIPYGLPLYLEAQLPPWPGQAPEDFSRLMVAQDTGGAIRGPVRGDVFFGSGDEAEYMAGYMKNRGFYSILVPREAAYQLR